MLLAGALIVCLALGFFGETSSIILGRVSVAFLSSSLLLEDARITFFEVETMSSSCFFHSPSSAFHFWLIRSSL